MTESEFLVKLRGDLIRLRTDTEKTDVDVVTSDGKTVLHKGHAQNLLFLYDELFSSVEKRIAHLSSLNC